MSDKRSAKIGRDAVGNIIITGDKNKIKAQIDAALKKAASRPASSIDISKELQQIRIILEKVAGEHVKKVGRALDDAADEVKKARPDKDEIGTALGRALEYAKKGGALTDEIEKLLPHVGNAVAWLGSNWHKLIPLVGMVTP